MIVYLVKKEMTCWEVVSRSLVKLSVMVVMYLPASAEGGSSPKKITLPL